MMKYLRKIQSLGALGYLNWVPDKIYIKLIYRARMGRKLHLREPETFNEKIQWLKLYDRNPLYTTMVDKFEVKKYVADRIGEEYIIPTLGIWERFEDINFERLPEQFVLKCTHDSGGLVICTDKNKFDQKKSKEKIEKSLKCNYYWSGREWPYKNVKPRIIAEKYMLDMKSGELPDYKWFCFNGKPRIMFITTKRNDESVETKCDFFDMDFKHLDITNGRPSGGENIEKPATFEKMKMLAEKLSKGIPQVRIDFYEVNGNVYFGEITFAHWSGLEPFTPEKWDKVLGEMIELPNKYKKK